MSDNPTAGGNAIAAVRGGGYWKEIVLIAALIVAGVTGYSWLKAHDAWIRYEALAQQKDAQIAQRDADARKYRADIEQLKRQAQTPQQVVRLIPQIIKVPADLPEPVVIEHPNQLTQQDVSRLPDAPSTLLPDQTAKLLTDQAADDLACQKSWATCQQNYADMKKERDAAVSARKGSFLQRAKQIAIGIAIGGVIGYAARR
ncbi:MAG TPA: hypothetical protein VES66_03435 [Terriglobales bacterium]|nr:hypothetical protein [Terriglobales bacterium]